MSNMGQFGNKNAPWGRSNTSSNMVNQGNALQPQMMGQGSLGNLNSQGLVQFQQHQQVFQNAMGLQQQNLGLGLQQMANSAMGAASLGSQLASNSIFQQVGAVSYPNSRSLNPAAFQSQNIGSGMGSMTSVQNNPSSGIKNRVFTGTVTTLHDNFGFVDDEVFFPINVCVKGSNPMVGDRVLVEASFNSTTPFKWNASRIQVLTANSHSQAMQNKPYSGGNNYSAVPPPSDNNNHFGRNRPKASMGGRGRERSRERERDDDEVERKRRREERLREREKEEKKSPIRRRSRSPKARRRSRIVPRYMVQIPKIPLNLPESDVLEIRRRYNNLYVPSDFFFTHIRWVDAFPPHKPYTLNKPCSFHIINKELDPVGENSAVLEPPDADYTFSAKVMLMSIPGLEELYQKCCVIAEDKDKDEERDFVHPTRLISFLVGLRGKNETMAIGGPWSPSLDGENPDKDPAVLIRTAIRTCKALTGIDLSNCTQWYRFVELYYRRSDSIHKGKSVPARVETVVLYLPDVWSCLPTRLEWENLHQIYRKQLEILLKSSDQEADDTSATDEKEEEVVSDKMEPTHYSQLDPKTMTVSSLRTELKARNINSKGLKSQLVARLTKAIKAEAEKGEEKGNDGEKEEKNGESESTEPVQDEKKVEVEEKLLGEKEKALLEKRFKLPEQPQLIVHPSKTAKSGKFDCTTMSLSLLLDYRPEDTKEHSFEVSLFAELFNEMLMRDFGFNIFSALYKLPEKPKEKDDKKKKEEDKKSDDKKKDKKEDDSKKNDDKKNQDGENRKHKNDEDKKDSKKNDKKSDESGDDEETEDGSDKKGKKEKDKRKKERVKMYTKDRHLLLSFVYFDQTHCGYIFDKDIEELLYTLGLDLSRAQVRKLVSKVIVRDSLHYRKLTDKPKDEDIPMATDDDDSNENLEELSVTNKKLLPVFHEGGRPTRRHEISASGATIPSEEGLVTFRGAVVDIGKLLSQLERSEKTRLETESRLVEVKTENNKLLEKYHKSHSSIKHLNSEVKEYKDKLRTSEDALSRVNTQSKMFHTLLIDIHDQIEPVLHKASHKDKDQDRDRDRKQEENKSRWEKDQKKLSHDETKTETKSEAVNSEVTEVKKENDA